MMRCTLFACCAWLCCAQIASGQAFNEYDQRVAAALYATKDGTLRDPATMNADAFKGLRRFEKDSAKKTAQYILEIGAVKDNMDLRGLLRIGVGESLPPAGAGFEPAKTKPAEVGDAEVLIRKIETDAEKFYDIGVRKGFGNITLLARQRRPLHEPINDAVKAVAVHYTNLVRAAEHYKLFVGKMRLINLSEPDQVDIAERPLPCLLSDQVETQYVIRAEVVDNDGNPMTNVKKMSFLLKGRLASLAKVQAAGQDVTNPTRKFDVDDPRGAVELIVTFPKLDEATRQRVFQEFAAASAAGEAPLWFRYSASFK